MAKNDVTVPSGADPEDAKLVLWFVVSLGALLVLVGLALAVLRVAWWGLTGG